MRWDPHLELQLIARLHALTAVLKAKPREAEVHPGVGCEPRLGSGELVPEPDPRLKARRGPAIAVRRRLEVERRSSAGDLRDDAFSPRCIPGEAHDHVSARLERRFDARSVDRHAAFRSTLRA